HPRPRLGDDPALAQATGEQYLAQRVVDLVRARVVQVLALEVDPVAGRLRQSRRERHRGRAADEVPQQRIELTAEAGVVPEARPGRGEFVQRRDQDLGYVPAA